MITKETFFKRMSEARDELFRNGATAYGVRLTDDNCVELSGECHDGLRTITVRPLEA